MSSVTADARDVTAMRGARGAPAPRPAATGSASSRARWRTAPARQPGVHGRHHVGERQRARGQRVAVHLDQHAPATPPPTVATSATPGIAASAGTQHLRPAGGGARAAAGRASDRRARTGRPTRCSTPRARRARARVAGSRVARRLDALDDLAAAPRPARPRSRTRRRRTPCRSSTGRAPPPRRRRRRATPSSTRVTSLATSLAGWPIQSATSTICGSARSGITSRASERRAELAQQRQQQRRDDDAPAVARAPGDQARGHGAPRRFSGAASPRSRCSASTKNAFETTTRSPALEPRHDRAHAEEAAAHAHRPPIEHARRLATTSTYGPSGARTIAASGTTSGAVAPPASFNQPASPARNADASPSARSSTCQVVSSHGRAAVDRFAAPPPPRRAPPSARRRRAPAAESVAISSS